MKLTKAFFKLIRWPNLVFIVVTQCLFMYCIVWPVFNQSSKIPNLHGVNLILLNLASVLIAAAGYIINDYFDLNIDRINKPDKLVVEKFISRRWTIIWHLVLSGVGILISFYLDLSTPIAFLGIANTICVALLFLYSISLKKKLLAGNILISLLTAWVVLVIAWCETSHFVYNSNIVNTTRISRFTFLYAGFAFIISLVREVVKDMEDVEGDRRYGCYTMPIAWGMNASKLFAAIWLIVLLAVLAIIQFYVLQFKWWFSILYCVLCIIIPLCKALNDLRKAQTQKDYHSLSSLIKLIMFTGILSMIFIKIYSL